MKTRRDFIFRILSIVLLAWLIVGGSRTAPAQESPAPAGGSLQITGVPEDWTHHHLVFSDPGSEEAAIENGTHEHWLAVVNDPRYILQQAKRRGPAGNMRARIKTDWGMILGSGAKVGAGMYPAKYSFNGSPQCGNAASPDFVVYNTSLAGSASQASVLAYDNLYTGCTSAQVPSVYWAFSTGGTVVTSVVLSGSGSQVAFVQTPSSGNAQLVLLKWGATPPGRTVTGSVTSGSKNFSISSGTLTNADVGAVIAGGGIPTGDTIATVTSSSTGTMFTAASTTHSGEMLAISADAGAPDTLTAVSNANYPTCTAPCMTTLSFSGTSRQDTISSPFYDYGSDTLYVGDASGGLHKFHPVFNGTAGTPPAEVGTPFASPSTTALSSPVHDAASGLVFVGDAAGRLHSVNTSGTVITSVQVATGSGIVDGPLVDSSAEQVYVFVSSDLNGSAMQSACNGSGAGALACNGVIQFPASFTGSSDYTESVIGVNSTETIYIGAFDNLYWNSGTGNLYVNGINNNTGTPKPKLARIPVTTSGFSSNACQAGTTLPPNCSSQQCAINIDNPMTSALAMPAPVTEIFNNPNDWIFTSVSAGSSLTGVSGCPTGNGCGYSWNVTAPLSAGATPSAGLITNGGTSGIIIDNTNSSPAGASQVYFSTLSNESCTTSGGTGGCAVQASQSALQ